MNHLVQTGDGYWSIRGSFRLAGLIDLGTQAALVRLADGRFVMLDSYTLPAEVRAEVDRLTGGRIAAILNLHPFHTLHCAALHAAFPEARLIGTARHHAKLPDLPWDSLKTEDPALWHEFAADFDFTIPEGVDFISANPNLHFASVMLRHRASSTIHVDDTFTCLPPGRLGRALGRKPKLSFHMTLGKVLQPRPGAVAEFRSWAAKLIADWGDSQTICLAHNAVLTARDLGHETLGPAMQDALARAEPKLAAHEAKHG